jgi:hypothetical protein
VESKLQDKTNQKIRGTLIVNIEIRERIHTHTHTSDTTLLNETIYEDDDEDDQQ